MRLRSGSILLGILMMIIACSVMAGNKDDWVEVPGDDVYGIKFEVDWSVFNSGTFSYGPEGSTVRRIGGGRAEYRAFFDLTLDFSLKDGRHYKEVIDVDALMRELVNRVEVFDNRHSRWGGTATLLITISRSELALNYRVSERILEPDYELNDHYYPLYKKVLD